MTDPRKIAEIHALTRPNAQAREGAPEREEEWDDRSLPPGARVGEFEITGIIGKGGFGIVYLAWDHSLERVVALKEYMPAAFASRKERTRVSPLSERHRETFQVGLNSFVNEAKLLAQFHSPSLVEVHRFWEENGTAYMVMPYYRGKTLAETVRAFSGPPDEAWLLDLLAPLTESLMELHSVQCYHRDIAPDNILILDDTGAPLLLDFGAARRVIAGQGHALTIILKAGYAPVEQYGEVPGMQQGPWTDVYALASVVYWAVTGNTPPQATIRMIRDTCVPLAECAPAGYSRAFATAIDRALAVLPEARTQSVEALRGELGLGPATVRRTAAPLRWSDADATVVVLPRTATTGPQPTVPQAARPVAPEGRASPPAPAAPAPAPSQPRRMALVAAIGAAALLTAVAGGMWLFSTSGDAPPAPQAPQAASEPAADPPRQAPSPPPAPVAAPPVPETIPAPQSAAAALDLILARKDPSLRVGVSLGAGTSRRSVRYTSSEPGHLYLMGVREGGGEPLVLLLPDSGAAPAPVQSSGKLDLPLARLQPGRWRFALVVARQPVDPASFGWVAEDRQWKRRFGGNAGTGLPWAIPACISGDAQCVAAYGAGAFELAIDAAPPPAAPKPAAQPDKHDRQAAQAPRPERAARQDKPPQGAKPAPHPECERILVRLSLGETGQDLIERMKTLKCN